jgi:hypothetical protein
MKIEKRETKETNLSLALDFLSFLIELCCFFFVCPASKSTCGITTTYYYRRTKIYIHK